MSYFDEEILRAHDEVFETQRTSISLDEWLLPKWFRDKTYNFPFLSFIFTLGLLYGMYWLLNTVDKTAYDRGKRDATVEKVK